MSGSRVGVAGADAINFAWLVRLRWGALAGQTLTILAVDALMGIDLPLGTLLAIVVVGAASNLACRAAVRRGALIREHHLALVMGLDVLLLTALLYQSGGPFNPFSFLYLVHLALAAVVVRPAYAWGLLALSLACFGLLFFDHRPLRLEASGEGTAQGHVHLHLQGMWVAFGVAAAFIVHFVQRVRRALAARDEELLQQKSLAARTEKLASLAALAAGAAHELSTPLSTIAVVARELELTIERDVPRSELADDARLIRQQVERCRMILVQLAADAGENSGEAIVALAPRDLVETALADVHEPDRIRVVVSDAASAVTVAVPQRAVSQALRAVVENARQASPPGAAIELRVARAGQAVQIEVTDRGPGMAPALLARCGEPFFTTKEPGQGMGLGLFLTRTVLERIGGRLELSSTEGRGTRATLVVPLAARPERVASGAGG